QTASATRRALCSSQSWLSKSSRLIRYPRARLPEHAQRRKGVVDAARPPHPDRVRALPRILEMETPGRLHSSNEYPRFAPTDKLHPPRPRASEPAIGQPACVRAERTLTVASADGVTRGGSIFDGVPHRGRNGQ